LIFRGSLDFCQSQNQVNSFAVFLLIFLPLIISFNYLHGTQPSGERSTKTRGQEFLEFQLRARSMAKIASFYPSPSNDQTTIAIRRGEIAVNSF
jgi:hypothetical protein